MSDKIEFFNILKKIDVNDKTNKKGKFNYLSWSFAVEEISKACPDWIYEIEQFDNLPYIYDENTGYMVFTNITAFGIKKRMWLPVMDFKNNAIKKADMMDINKAIMRCLVKNIAMFGLGLSIYEGEDLPEDNPDNKKEKHIEEERQKKIENAKQKLLNAKSLEELATVFKGLDAKIKSNVEDLKNKLKAGFQQHIEEEERLAIEEESKD